MGPMGPPPLAALLAALAALGTAHPQGKPVALAEDNVTVAKDTVLKPGVYKIRDADRNGAIRITKDGVTLDGNGAVIDGQALEGIGVVAENVKNVTIKNLTIRGFATGIRLDRVHGAVVERNDVSENFANPGAQWGNGDPVAGIVLLDSSGCMVRENVAAKNWNGILLTRSDKNVIQQNRADHSNNWGLRLWRSSSNHVKDNDFSHAIRCEGEAHACDSAAILVESGSNGNRFVGNDATHSGDGIFVRALDAIVSRDNLFSGNDVSYAHNNGFECWCPDNVFKNNKANRCGYGFWLGSSDGAWVEANEIKENGVEGTNAANGTAGLAYIGGGTNVNIHFNVIEGNAGPGIHVRGNPPAFPSAHVLIQQNSIRRNKEGVRLEFVDFCDVRGNVFEGNATQPDVIQGEKCADVLVVEGVAMRGRRNPPTFELRSALETRAAGESVAFEAVNAKCFDGRKAAIRWDFGDGTKGEGAAVKHTYVRPGFYRVSMFADDGLLATTGQAHLYVVVSDPEFTELNAVKWIGEAPNWKDGWVRLADDLSTKVRGKSSLHVVTNSGEDVVVAFPRARDAKWNLTGKRALQLWIKFRNENDNGFQNNTPIVRLIDAHGKAGEASYFEYKPRNGNLLGLTVPYSEGRWLFNFFEIPLAGDAVWERTTVGTPDLRQIDALEIHADTWGAGFELWIDGAAFVK